MILYLLDGKGWVNCGFLYGPYLPIYGFGAVLMLLALQALAEQPDLVFLLGAALSGAVEWLSGEALWALYGQRWWDYTGYPYQIRGFVCLHSVLAFGLGGLPRGETALFAPGHGGAHQVDEGLHLANLKRALLIFAMGLLEADRVLA